MRHWSRLVTIIVAYTILPLVGITAYAQIAAVAPCESAISAKIQIDHNAVAHFEDHLGYERDTVGDIRLDGRGDYTSGSLYKFTFECVFDENNKRVASTYYEEYEVAGERFVPPRRQAQDCREQTVVKVSASEGYTQRVFTIPQSIVSKTKKNGDRSIYGDGSLETGPFRFNCTYRDGRLIKFDYHKETGPLYGGAVPPPQ